MATTIQVSGRLLEHLKSRKMYNDESYEDIIWDLLEDSMEISERTKKQIKNSESEILKGKTTSLEEIKKKLRL